jgi:hypothetical protein
MQNQYADMAKHHKVALSRRPKPATGSDKRARHGAKYSREEMDRMVRRIAGQNERRLANVLFKDLCRDNYNENLHPCNWAGKTTRTIVGSGLMRENLTDARPIRCRIRHCPKAR